MHIDVEYHVVAALHAVLYLGAQSAIVAAGVNLLVFHKSILGYEVMELLVGKEVIVHSVDLAGTRLAVCGRYGEFHRELPAVHYIAYNR